MHTHERKTFIKLFILLYRRVDIYSHTSSLARIQVTVNTGSSPYINDS